MSTTGEVIIKKRHRPTARIRERSLSPERSFSPPAGAGASAGVNTPDEPGSDEEVNLPYVSFSFTLNFFFERGHDAHIHSLDELLEHRRLRRARQGIDVGKLNKGEPKKRKKNEDDGSTVTPTGLIKSAQEEPVLDESVSISFVSGVC